ncbi:unnamed protein product, partial [Owenia fusiformis]
MATQVKIEPFNRLITHIGNDLLEDDIASLKMLLRGPKFERGILEGAAKGLELIELLVSKETVSKSDVSYLTKLLTEIGRIDLARKVEEYDEFGDETSILDAVQAGKINGVKKILSRQKNSLDKDQRDSDGCTVLHIAVKHNDIDIARSLIDAGFDINATDEREWTVLRHAVYRSNLDMIRLLVDSKVDIASDPYGDVIDLAVGKSSLQLEMCQELLRGGSDIMYTDEEGTNILNHAICSQSPLEVIELCIKRGCDVNNHNRYNDTPLYNTSSDLSMTEESKLKVSKMLVEAGCDVNAKCQQGRTVLIRTVMNDHPELFKYLISLENIDPNIADEDGDNALHEAAKCRSPKYLELIIESGKVSNLDELNDSGYAALHLAVLYYGKSAIPKLDTLFTAGCDVSVQNKTGKTILHVLCVVGNLPESLRCEILEHLLQNEKVKSIVNNKDQDEFTALHYAVKEMHPGLVKILLQNKARVNISNKFGQTVLDLPASRDASINHMLKLEKHRIEESVTYVDAVTFLQKLNHTITKDDIFEKKSEALDHILKLKDLIEDHISTEGGGLDMLMPPEDRELIRSNYATLGDEIEPGSLLSHLLQLGVLTPDLKDEIEA